MRYIRWMLLIIASILITSSIVSLYTLPHEIVYDDHYMDYQKTLNGPHIYLHLKYFQDKNNQLHININYVINSSVLADVTISKFSWGNGTVLTSTKIPVSGLNFTDTEIFNDQSGSWMNYGIDFTYYNGEINTGTVIVRTNQLLSLQDYILYFTKVLLPVLGFMLPTLIPREDDKGKIRRLDYFSPTMALVGLSFFTIFFPVGPFIFTLISSLALLTLHFKFADNNKTISILVMLMITVGFTPIGLGDGYLSTKLRDLGYQFYLFPWITSIFMVLLFVSLVNEMIKFMKDKYPLEKIQYDTKLRDQHRDDWYHIILLTLVLIVYYIILNRTI